MSPQELTLAIKAAKKLPKPAKKRKAIVSRAVPGCEISFDTTQRRDGSELPRHVYRGYKGRFNVRVQIDGEGHYLGTFPTTSAAVDRLREFSNDQAK
jgi:hypothetical protein